MVHQLSSTPQNSQAIVVFHLARDPEFREGLEHGRQMLPAECDLSGHEGWWDVAKLIQFVQTELSPENQARENAVRQVFDAAPRTPIYHLGLVAGYLARFAEAAQAEEEHA